MLEELRFDRGTISPNWEKTPEGFLRVKATFSRTGCQRYRRQDGSEVVEYRPEEEVAKRDSILSLGGLPVTLEHPPQLLTPENTRQYQRGSTGTEVVYDNGFIKGIVTLTDAEAIQAVERGDARELSVGYRVQVDHTPGTTPSGERYDCIQRQISGNHVAVTKEGRAGPEVRLHMDSATSIDPLPPVSEEAHEMTTAVAALSSATEALAGALKDANRADSYMKKAMHPVMDEDGADPGEEEMEDPDEEMEGEEMMEGEMMEEPMAMPAAKRGRKDSASVSRAEYNRIVAELEESQRLHQADLGRMDAIAERLDELESELETRTDGASIQDFDALLEQRLELLEKANELAGERIDHAGLSPREIQLEAMEKAGIDTDRFSERSDDYVDAAFDNYVESGTGRIDTADALAQLLGNAGSAPGADQDPAARMIERQKAASEQPLTHHVSNGVS